MAELLLWRKRELKSLSSSGILEEAGGEKGSWSRNLESTDVSSAPYLQSPSPFYMPLPPRATDVQAGGCMMEGGGGGGRSRGAGGGGCL